MRVWLANYVSVSTYRLLIAFNDVFILRPNRTNVKLWQRLMVAHTVSDLLYCYAMIQDIGFARFANPLMWTTAVDWLVAGTTILGLGAKVGVLLGLGVGNHEEGQEEMKIN